MNSIIESMNQLAQIEGQDIVLDLHYQSSGLTKNTSASNRDEKRLNEMLAYFKSLEDFDAEWMFCKKEISSNNTKKTGCSSRAPSNRSTTKKRRTSLVVSEDKFQPQLDMRDWEFYDDITRISLEIMFHLFYKNNFDEEYRFVDISPKRQIDLKNWVEIDHDDDSFKRKIKRVKEQIKVRPVASPKFMDADPFILNDSFSSIRNF